MKPERWQQLDELFHAALERAPEMRAAFLDEACAGDQSLREEVVVLLAAHKEAGSFIESPALEIEAKSLAREQRDAAPQSLLGETVGHCRLVSVLGSGGMGQVYLAHDTALNRQVALKLLPEYFIKDRDRLRRFQQEARAASALNHPNIITIYEIGQDEDRHFIATEFIDGITLRQRLLEEDKQTKPLALREVLDIAIQTADALAAAHEAHIVHRDIKPDNIMLRRRDGYVKVLDFGLAKPTEGETIVVDTEEAPTKTQLKTSPGVVMGTVSYMSPEQARGEQVDVRTDIWSLGVVIYEMAAGSVPFERSTPSEVIALILEREPPPLARYSREAPAELERIVSKALTKDREERYQTAKDLLIDLRRLRQRLEVEAEIVRTAQGHENGTVGKGSATGREQRAIITARAAAAEAGDAAVATNTSSTEYPASDIMRHRRRAFLLVTLLILTSLTAGGYGIYKLASKTNTPTVSFQGAIWDRLTTKGKVTRAVISPDGKFVVHVVRDAGQQSLRLWQVATASDKEIIAPAPVVYHSLTFTPDGNHIYYLLESRDVPKPALYRVSTLGVDPKRIPVNMEGDWVDLVRGAPISFSPDGKRFVFRRVDAGKEAALVIANADGSEEQKLVAHLPPEICGWPAWSPDGKTIAYVLGNFDSNDVTVFAARVGDGTFKPLTSRRWFRVERMAWLADGSGLLMLATAEQTGSSFQIWHLSNQNGEAKNLSNDLNNYVDLSLTEDSGALVTVTSEQLGNIWIATAGDAARARQVTTGAGRNEGGQGLSWTSDGRIVYCSVTGEDRDIWIIDADGQNQRQLTANSRINNQPSVSPDGRHIFFLSDRTGGPHIWRMDLDGSNQTQVTNGNGEQNPSCSPDGRWVLFRMVFGELTLWRAPVEGGKPVQLTEKGLGGLAAISPDGKLIAYFTDADGPLRIAIMSWDGGQPFRTFDVPPTLHIIGGISWMPDGGTLTYAATHQGVSNIWAQALDGGAPTKLTDFKSDRIFSFDWSRDGKQLALSRGSANSDAVMVSGFITQR